MESKPLSQRVSSYAVASLAALGSTASSHAAIIHYNSETTGTAPDNQTILSFNLAGDVAANSSVINEAFRFLNYSDVKSYLRLYALGVNRFYLNPLSAGTAIGAGGGEINPNSSLENLEGNGPFGSDVGPWETGQRAYLGLKFDNGGTPNFGWADVTINTFNSVTLHSYAYEDSGASILTAAVPEPSQVSLLILGAAGVLGYEARRRRKAVAA